MRYAAAAALGIALIATPTTALATDSLPAIQQAKSDITVEPTQELAKDYKFEDGDLLLQSIKLTGNSDDYTHTFELWGSMAGRTVTYYVQHANGNGEIIKRTVPEPKGGGSISMLSSTLDIDLQVEGWAIVTEVVDMWFGPYDLGEAWASPSYSVPYIEDSYTSFLESLTAVGEFHDYPYTDFEFAFAATEQKYLDQGYGFNSVGLIDTPGDPDGVLTRYADNYQPPQNGGKCLGSVEYQLNDLAAQEGSSDTEVGFIFKVDKKYAGMKAIAYISNDLSYDKGFGYTMHEMTVSDDGTFVVPYGMFSPHREDGGAYKNFQTLNLEGPYKINGVITINVEPKQYTANGTIIDYNRSADKVAITSNSCEVEVKASDLNLDIVVFDQYSSDGFYLIGYPYTETYGDDKSGYITYRFNAGKEHAGKTATVQIYRTHYMNNPTEIKTFKIQEDGTFLLKDKIEAKYSDISTSSPGVDGYYIYATVSYDMTTVADISTAAVSSIPDQTWTGKPLTPKPTVTVGDATLVEGEDYTLEYKDNTEEGTATITITGKGDYTGTKTVQFEIVKEDESDNPDDPGDEPGTSDPSKPGGTDDSDDADKPDYPAFDSPFSDVKYGEWYYDAVIRAQKLGLMNGYSGSDRFGPNDALSREQAAAVLYNLLGEGDTSSPSAPHADVEQGEWYSEAVNWAVEDGIMNGYADSDEFGIGDPLTREQFAAIIANACGAKVEDADHGALDRYPDKGGITDWAEDAVAWAVENKVINGVELSDGTRELRATETMNRAQMAAMMVNAVDSDIFKLD